MPRKPIGDVAMTGAERLRRFRERQREANPAPSDRQKLAQARAEIERLRQQLATAAPGAHQKPAGTAAERPQLQKQLATAKARIAELEASKGAIDPSTLSMTAQQKLDTAVRQEKARLAQQFHQMVNARVREFLEETILPRHRAEQAEAKLIYERRRGFMEKPTFRLIWSALHPDSRRSISDKKLAEAFDAFSGMEKYLLAEKDSPTDFAPLPKTMAEWDKMKAAATAARKAKRTKGGQAVRPR